LVVSVVKVTQNWKNWGFWKLPIRGPNGVVWGPNLHCFFSLATREKSAPEWRNL